MSLQAVKGLVNFLIPPLALGACASLGMQGENESFDPMLLGDDITTPNPKQFSADVALVRSIEYTRSLQISELSALPLVPNVLLVQAVRTIDSYGKDAIPMDSIKTVERLMSLFGTNKTCFMVSVKWNSPNKLGDSDLLVYLEFAGEKFHRLANASHQVSLTTHDNPGIQLNRDMHNLVYCAPVKINPEQAFALHVTTPGDLRLDYGRKINRLSWHPIGQPPLSSHTPTTQRRIMENLQSNPGFKTRLSKLLTLDPEILATAMKTSNYEWLDKKLNHESEDLTLEDRLLLGELVIIEAYKGESCHPMFMVTLLKSGALLHKDSVEKRTTHVQRKCQLYSMIQFMQIPSARQNLFIAVHNELIEQTTGIMSPPWLPVPKSKLDQLNALAKNESFFLSAFKESCDAGNTKHCLLYSKGNEDLTKLTSALKEIPVGNLGNPKKSENRKVVESILAQASKKVETGTK